MAKKGKYCWSVMGYESNERLNFLYLATCCLTRELYNMNFKTPSIIQKNATNKHHQLKQTNNKKQYYVS